MNVDQRPTRLSEEDSNDSIPMSSGQSTGDSTDLTQPPGETTTTGRLQAFRDIKRQLSEEELSSKGVQKLLLDELERTEYECENLKSYVERYHEADKRAAVLEERIRERIRSITAIDIMFGIGVALGGTIIGLAPTFWNEQPKGWVAIVIGSLFIAGASIARVVKR
jgi:hypothetical protein